MEIPKRLGHIWIGPKMAPVEWMQSWVEKHPSWDYTLYGNEFLRSGAFRTRPQIEEYMKRGWYAGVADLMRYEILYEFGGYLAEADSICLHPIDELFEDGGTLYTVYENEFLRGQFVSPILAAAPKHPFVKAVIDRLAAVPPEHLDHPRKQTGNLFIAQLIEELRPEIVIWPSYTLIPEHFLGRKYTGPGKVYARQIFGETTGAYRFSSVFERWREKRKALYASRARKRLRALKKQQGTG
jgi:mannosyltransferase OCH1-like enzyme